MAVGLMHTTNFYPVFGL